MDLSSRVLWLLERQKRKRYCCFYRLITPTVSLSSRSTIKKRNSFADSRTSSLSLWKSFSLIISGFSFLLIICSNHRSVKSYRQALSLFSFICFSFCESVIDRMLDRELVCGYRLMVTEHSLTCRPLTARSFLCLLPNSFTNSYYLLFISFS